MPQLINESGHHLLSVVNGILDMSKIETGNFEIMPEPFAPEHVIADACDMLRRQGARGRHRAVVRLAGKAAGDRRRQARAATRSCSIFCPTRSSSPIAAARSRSAPRRKSAVDRSCVTVEDTGVGIGADDLPRVGDPFFQARSSYDRRHDGTGLGLSIVKGLLALHGGDLEIVSRLGEGTRVTFHLPLDCESAAPRKRRRRSSKLAIERLLPRGAAGEPANIPVKKSA